MTIQKSKLNSPEQSQWVQEQPTTLKQSNGYGTPTIKVFGVGGGGSNAVNRMYKDKIEGVEYFCINTDAQHLAKLDVAHKIPIGQNITRGLGVGGHPELGRQAAEESRDVLSKLIEGADMVFIAAGLGGGTGTGATPIIAQLAKEAGALTVAVITKPFKFENQQRKRICEEGITRLENTTDTLIIIPNDRLSQLNESEGEDYTWEDALKLADSVLAEGIQSIAEVVTVPGEVNVDFADLKTIMGGAGAAWMSVGRASGENRAVEAARQATKSPLLDIAIDGAKRILFVISGGSTLTLKEVEQAADAIQGMADPEANVIFGTVKDLKMDDELKITLIAASFPLTPNYGEQQNIIDEIVQQTLVETRSYKENDSNIPSFMRTRNFKI